MDLTAYAERMKYPLLSDDEYAAMTTLPPEYLARLEHRNLRSSRVGRIATGAGATVALLAALPAAFNGWMLLGAVPFVIVFGAGLGWVVGLFVGLAPWKDDLSAEWRERYLADIGYEGRVSNDASKKAARAEAGWSGEDGPSYPITGNYDPVRFYSYSKDQRDYMRMTGMDADTYDSNMPG